MIIPKLALGLILLAGTSLSACSRKSADDVLANDPFAKAAARPEDQFGKGFGKAFRASPKSEPLNVVDGDLVAVSNTTEPVQIDTL